MAKKHDRLLGWPTGKEYGVADPGTTTGAGAPDGARKPRTWIQVCQVSDNNRFSDVDAKL